MSLDASALRLRCDSDDCGRTAPLPILRTNGHRPGLPSQSGASGWMFVASACEDRHYCPDCAVRRLKARSQ